MPTNRNNSTHRIVSFNISPSIEEHDVITTDSYAELFSLTKRCLYVDMKRWYI